MKLLGLRVCDHDSNISYFDGEQVHYIKTERIYREKHDAYGNLYEWEQDIKTIWGVNVKEIDQIGIVLDPWRYGLPPDPTSIFPHINYSLPLNTPPILKVDHHYAHTLSYWPLQTQTPKISIVVDGFGDYNIAWSVFKDDNIIDQGFIDQNGSIGIEMNKVGAILGLQGHNLDYAGKVMGLQTYGRIDYKFLNSLKGYNMSNIDQLFNIDLWYAHVKDPLLSKLTLINWVHTIHFRVGEILIDFFSKYCLPTDTISYTGGVAQNVLWNSKLKNKFPNLVISPHCGDEGLSLGIVEYLRRINNLPKFNPINFPYIQYQKTQNLDEHIKRTIQNLSK